MKVLFTTLLLAFTATFSFAQINYYWIGGNTGSGATWNSGSNWSLTSGGAAAGAVPTSGDNIYITTASSISLTTDGSFTVKGCQVSANLKVINNSATDALLTINDGVVTGGTGLIVDASATLECIGSTNATKLTVNNGGIVNGRLYFNVKAQLIAANAGTLEVFGTVEQATANTSEPFIKHSTDATLVLVHFNNASVFQVGRNYAFLQNMINTKFESNSTMRFYDTPNLGKYINTSFGNIELLGGSKLFANAGVGSNLGTSITCNNLTINSSAATAEIGDGTAATAMYIHVLGNLTIQSTLSTYMSNAAVSIIEVEGNLVISNNKKLDIRNHTLKLKGNITVNGEFGGYNPGNIELNGASAQILTISAGAGFTNAGYVNMKINNTAGVLLGSNVNYDNNGNLTIIDQAHLALGNFNYTMNGYISGPGTGHIATNGTGNLIVQKIPTAGKYIHVGADASSKDAVEVVPTALATATINVKKITNPSQYAGTPANPAKLFARQWDVSVTTPSTLTLTPDASSAPVAAVVNKIIGHFIGGVWTEKPTINPLIYKAAFTSYSPLVVGEAGAVLPIELLSFEASKSTVANKLTWATANERNASTFEVERLDGSKWVNIGFVKATGNTNSLQKYTFDDATPFAVSYYRLQMVDYNNQFEYSKTVAVSRSEKSSLKVYPTIANNTLTVETDGGTSSILSIVNVHGAVIVRKNISQNDAITTFDVRSLASGTYILLYQNTETGFTNSNTVRFVKQ